jgi:hypothetical protein
MREVEMSEATQLILGAETFCSDGACGEITRVVLDPLTRVVSHLVVEPKHRQGLGRMISWVLLDVSTAGILLKCTSAEFDAFDHAEETYSCRVPVAAQHMLQDTLFRSPMTAWLM